MGAAPTEVVLAAIGVEVEVVAFGVEVVAFGVEVVAIGVTVAFEVVAGKLDGVTELAGVAVLANRICSCWCNNP